MITECLKENGIKGWEWGKNGAKFLTGSIQGMSTGSTSVRNTNCGSPQRRLLMVVGTWHWRTEKEIGRPNTAYGRQATISLATTKVLFCRHQMFLHSIRPTCWWETIYPFISNYEQYLWKGCLILFSTRLATNTIKLPIHIHPWLHRRLRVMWISWK